MRTAPDDIAELMLAPTPGSSRITVSAVISACARHYGVAPGLLTEPDGGAGQRQRWIVRKRQVAMYLSRELTPHSTIQIGDMFGGRDHTTVIHACKHVKARMAEGNDFTSFDVRAVLKRLRHCSDGGGRVNDCRPKPATGHMPFEGHRTMAQVWAQQAQKERCNDPAYRAKCREAYLAREAQQYGREP